MKLSRISLLAVAAVALPTASQAQAAGSLDLTSLTAAADYTSISPMILAIGAVSMVPILAMVSVKWGRRLLRSS
jgi:hypothetical protein